MNTFIKLMLATLMMYAGTCNAATVNVLEKNDQSTTFEVLPRLGSVTLTYDDINGSYNKPHDISYLQEIREQIKKYPDATFNIYVPEAQIKETEDKINGILLTLSTHKRLENVEQKLNPPISIPWRKIAQYTLCLFAAYKFLTSSYNPIVVEW